MRRGVFAIGSTALALALLHCSLLVDTSGLSGGAKPGADSGALAEAAISGANDAPITSGEAGGNVDASSNALGPLWLAYGTAAGAMGVRPWDAAGNAWAAEQPGPGVGGDLVHWVVPKETPFGSFLAVESSGPTAAHLDVFERAADGAWVLGFSVPMTASATRAFDIEYEARGNTVLVVYADTTAAPQSRVRTTAGWSAPTAAPTTETVSPAWIELARNPITNEIALVYSDQNRTLLTNAWNGAWGTTQRLDTGVNSVDFKCFDAAYENGSGQLLVAWGETSKDDEGGTVIEMRYATRPIGAPFDAKSTMNPGTPPGPLVLTSEPSTNRIALAYLEYSCNKVDQGCDDFVTAVWNGQDFIADTDLDGNTTTIYNNRPGSMPTGTAWLGTTGFAIAAFHRDLADPGQLPFTRFNGTTTWRAVAGANAPPSLPARASMQLVSAPGPLVVAVVEGTEGSLWSKAYGNETAGFGTWSDVGGSAPLASGLLTSSGVPFGVTTP